MQKLLLDMSSILWSCLLAGKDEEHGRELPHPDTDKRPVWVNSAEFGYENLLNSVAATLKKFNAAPRDIVMVFEGANSKSLRKQISDTYKAGRSHHPAYYEEFEKLAAKARKTFLGLGALAVWQDGLESDDVLCYLVQALKFKHTIVSNDGDLLVLQGPHTDVYRGGELNGNKYGPFPPKYITLYKALVGDPSDNIKGAFKFGPKAFIDLYCAFDEHGLDAMIGLIESRKLEELHEDVADLKCLQRVIDSKESVYQSWDLARMYPTKVNTARMPLQVRAGKVEQWNPHEHDHRLKQWYGATNLVHAGNFDDACVWAMGKLLESDHVAFDIETSTPPESDEWLLEKKRSSGGEDGEKLGVDVFGSELTGCSVTFGDNQQYTLYFTIDHVETDAHKNLTSEQVRQFMELIPDSKKIIVQNASCELSVCCRAWGEAWKDNGWHGFLPNVEDTKIMKSYVDENSPLGLKDMSEAILGYKQVTYGEVTQGRKMNQMTAAETLRYGADDAICTSALYTYFRFVMELEQTYEVMRQVEITPAYLNALRFVQGTPISMERMLELECEDNVSYEAAWEMVRQFLMSKGWEGTVCPKFQALTDLTPNRIKEAFEIVTGRELKTQVRTPEKLFKLIAVEPGAEVLANLLTQASLPPQPASSWECLNAYVKAYFKGDPILNLDSPPQMQKLLYETLGLPIRLRNKPTDAMRAKGIKEGNPRGDDLALQFALAFDADRGPEMQKILKAVQTMKIVLTRRKMFYNPYRCIRHWKDQLVHAQVIQCAARTRRYASADPNLQQLPKHEKHGHDPLFRQIFVPHKERAVVVSIDFGGQELRAIADQSKDENMLACFIGDEKKDMHALTGVGIIHKRRPDALWAMTGGGGITPEALQEAATRWKGYTYDQFAAAISDLKHPDYRLLKQIRPLAKKTNFTTEYGAQAPKLSETLVIPQEEAQLYIEAKHEAFPRAEAWKKEMTALAHKLGYMMTMLGARRHLPDLNSSNKYDVLKAERQAVNYRIQGSCAEMTKQAEGRLWESGIYFRYDARYIGPIHDELISSCAVEHAVDFIREKHALMIQNYAGMTVPIVGSISLGLNFKDQIECGDEFDEARIHKALQQIGFADIMTPA